MNIDNSKQRDFFRSGESRALLCRRQALLSLRQAIERHERDLYAALSTDLHKSEQEAFLTEVSIVYGEINYALKHLERWAKDKRVAPVLSVLPSSSRIHYEPLGTALIIAPWNYPVNLLFCPLVGALAAGCTAVLKSSPYTPNVDKALETIVREAFSEEYVGYVSGGRDVNRALLALRWDIIFYTGSPRVAHVVAEAAAKHLTPCVLELGGKSPCIIAESADLDVAARRVAWGKLINAGQTCIAPDYFLVHRSVHERFVKLLRGYIEQFYGPQPAGSEFYPHIVRREAVERLRSLVPFDVQSEGRAFPPVIIENVHVADPVMQEEIFGPIFPIIDYDTIDEAVDFINSREKPLALYYFGRKREGRNVIARTSSGGACLNDTLMHITNPNLPFGGVGNSGMGKYHRHESFLAFSNARAVVSSVTWFDLGVKFVPFRGLSRLKGLLK